MDDTSAVALPAIPSQDGNGLVEARTLLADPDPFVAEAAPMVVPAAVSSTPRVSAALDRVENGMETMLFASRWLLAPLYVGLVAGLLVIIVKFTQALWELISHAVSDDFKTVILGMLELLDITLLANLVLIVVFAGYENFVSKIGAAEGSEDRPHWMGKVDYSGLKMKLIGSVVAISVIGLLQDFLNMTPHNYRIEPWRIGIHLTFLFSGVLFALMDFIAERRPAVELS